MITKPNNKATTQADPAMLNPRIVISQVAPSICGGRYPAKATVNQSITVSATIFMDGHDKLAARVIYRDQPDADWQSKTMTPRGNDYWDATLLPTRTGMLEFHIEAWFDQWASFYNEVAKKYRAGVPLKVEIEEGKLHILAALHASRDIQQPPHSVTEDGWHINPSEEEYAPDHSVHVLEKAINDLGHADGEMEKVHILLDHHVFKAMECLEERRFYYRTEQPLPIEVERTAAGFASWYELFPRSATHDPNVHGTFQDVIARLPAVQAMGFDVLYFPPIHPIGIKNRKGRNNSLTAQPGEPGSPYAIGADDGGHDAVLEELGGIEQFRQLRSAATEFGIELAMDFAIQCSPDHPWLREHPDWFSWRPDGSIRYAENPPKKYEDIVNVNFYAATALPDMWEAWRDILLYWIGEGVKIFRVDNPHTKPLPFWEWLIKDLRRQHPEVLFLSEAFTRPAMMYQLAKIGFNQSYTYFIWRNTKQELTEYMQELSSSPVKDFYRPNFFVNTPDINPYFLQSSGRPGFLIRAALATTLSGLWGMYSGFEICEAAALPGREEYLDAEKYEIKARNNQTLGKQAPGNIVREISRLNHIRKENPALQTHLNIHFLESNNDQVLFYLKQTHDRSNTILVAVSLDPHHHQEAWLEVPLQQFGLDVSFSVVELMNNHHLHWNPDRQHWYFKPEEMPFAIFKVIPTRSEESKRANAT